VQRDGDSVVCFHVPEVPSVGYRVFSLGEERAEAAAGPWQADGCRLEGPFYAVEASPITGGIVSLRDKVRGRELVDPDSAYHLNQALYLSGEVEHTPRRATVEVGSCGPVYAELIVTAQLKNTQVTTTITLYSQIDRVDIRNEVEKTPTSEKQEFDFIFPFHVPQARLHIEAPGVILAPKDDFRPGAGQAVNAVRHFVDLSGDEYGVTLAQADSGLVEFGHRTTSDDPLTTDAGNGTVLALAMENCIDWHEAIRDQAGVSRFVFRFSLRGHAGGFDPVRAVRFGWEDNNELATLAVDGGQEGALPCGSHSFLSVGPDNVVLTSLKVAEECGLIVRLWECGGSDAEATLRTSGLGVLRSANRTDLLEVDAEPLELGESGATICVPARSIRSARLVVAGG
jgi:alpha-mannosidase